MRLYVAGRNIDFQVKQHFRTCRYDMAGAYHKKSSFGGLSRKLCRSNSVYDRMLFMTVKIKGLVV